MKPETRLQISIVEMLSIYSQRYGFLFFAVPNEGFLTAWFASGGADSGRGKKGVKMNAMLTSLKKMGMTPGVSDLVIGCDGKMFCLEVKGDKGVQSENQVRFQQWCERTGVPYEVVRSVDETLGVLKRWGVV